MERAKFQNRRSIMIGLAVVIALLAVVVAGYIGARYVLNRTAKTPAADTQQPVTGSKPTYNKTELVHSTEMPADLPSGSPLYKDATLISASSDLIGDEGKTFSLDFRSDKKPAEVFEFYRNAFNTNGWKADTVETKNNAYTIMATNVKNNLQATFTSTADENDDAGASFQLLMTVISPSE